MFSKFQSQILSGYLSKDPEIKYLESGSCICKFSIPLQETKESETVWCNGEAWNAPGEKIAELKKGDLVTVVGKVKIDTYQGKEYPKFNVTAVL